MADSRSRTVRAGHPDYPRKLTAVFTGIVEEVGIVATMEPVGNGLNFLITASHVLGGLVVGDSIAVDGVCLTATAVGAESFTVQAVATTLGRTTLGIYTPGRRVNLERALAFGARLGGHLVQGHVDGVGHICAITPRDELVLIDFTVPNEVVGVTVLHGSITLNGISLTVNALPSPGVCQVSIIPHTWAHTALAELSVNDSMNVEGDMIGKHVRSLLSAPANGADLRRAWGY